MTALMAFSLKRSNIIDIEEAAEELVDGVGPAELTRPAIDDPRNEEPLDEKLPPLAKPPETPRETLPARFWREPLCRKGTAAAKLTTAASTAAAPVPAPACVAVLLLPAA
mmetsp:Transcript_3987/g.11671  ORF Transcript_3987/g.11671 Transcript_3987/m.11671 type:complete len:110 (-) Transcript_3987:370-699(-)